MVQSKKFDIPIICFRLFACAIALLQAYANQFTVYTEDVISYLDHADVLLRGDFHWGLSAYWGPEYSFALAAVKLLFHPSAYWEFPSIKIVNLTHFVLLMFGFELFFKRLLQLHQSRVEEFEQQGLMLPSVRSVQLCLYAVFLCFNLSYGGVYHDTPDLILSALLMFASYFLMGVVYFGGKLRDVIGTTVIIALAYLCKAVAFPLSFSYFFLLAVSARTVKVALKRLAVAVPIWAIIIAPFVIATSTNVGRLTFSDSAPLNYAWAVQQCAPFLHPLAGYPVRDGCKHLKHPTRIIFNDPQVFEFAEPVPGTFPIWYEPHYWYEGIEIGFSAFKQFVASVASISVVVRLFYGPMLLPWLVLAIASRQRGLNARLFVRNLPIMLPGLFGTCLYIWCHNVHMVYTSRYFPAYLTLVFSGLLISVALKDNGRWQKAYLYSMITTVCMFSISLIMQINDDLRLAASGPPPTSYNVAQDLKFFGINPGDRLCSMDPTRQYWWARVARIQLVAEIPDRDKFFMDYPEKAQQIAQALAKYDIKGIVALPGPNLKTVQSDPHWKQLAGTERWFYAINPVETAK